MLWQRETHIKQKGPETVVHHVGIELITFRPRQQRHPVLQHFCSPPQTLSQKGSSNGVKSITKIYKWLPRNKNKYVGQLAFLHGVSCIAVSSFWRYIATDCIGSVNSITSGGANDENFVKIAFCLSVLIHWLTHLTMSITYTYTHVCIWYIHINTYIYGHHFNSRCPIINRHTTTGCVLPFY